MIMRLINVSGLLLFMIGTTLSSVDASQGSSDNADLRIDFIEKRLDANRQHARYWQNGWSSFYAASALIQTGLWIGSDNNDDSINYSIGALKSAAGLADMLLRPHPARYGADPVRTLSVEPSDERDRLDRGETLLRGSADRARSRRTWQPHLKIIGVNLLAGGLIAAFGDDDDALASTALGLAVGEANIWTQPSRPESDWQDYQTAFPHQESFLERRWQLVPIAGGLALQGRF
ncbi:MAG: hypothetical protein JRD88_01455 [Deltaproteobacteria bacterium]|jgi:hypothetical protein|nr:hypothetical protein [Deltaproteobacteria bacterium]